QQPGPCPVQEGCFREHGSAPLRDRCLTHWQMNILSSAHLRDRPKCYCQSGGVNLVRFWPGLVFAAGMMAQELAPIGIVRGALIECDATHLTLGVDESRVFRFLTDGRTFIERDHLRIFCSTLGKGERLE